MNGKKAKALRAQAKKHTLDAEGERRWVYRTLKYWYRKGRLVI